MNAKTAKRLRREARYHPSDKRTYEIIGKSRTYELGSDCSKALYKELKKETQNGGI